MSKAVSAAAPEPPSEVRPTLLERWHDGGNNPAEGFLSAPIQRAAPGVFSAAVAAIAQAAGDRGARIVNLMLFAPAALMSDAQAAAATIPACPRLFVLTNDDHHGGIYAHAWSGEVHGFRDPSGAEASVLVTPGGRLLLGSGLLPADALAPAGEQTRSVLDRMESLLMASGFDISHLVRTRFYNDDILSWYSEFNRARTAFFRERGVFHRLLPASTGIGAANPAGAALAAGLVAVQSTGSLTCRSVPSPLQAPAGAYGSSFSRAVEIVATDCRRVLISGTASIDRAGRTTQVGDVEAQVRTTLDVVEAILRSGGYSWKDTVRGIAYVRKASDVPAARAVLAARVGADAPILWVPSTVCRDDLLFELELDALRRGEG